MRFDQNGFNLIELMIAVAIVGILAAIAVPSYVDNVIRARMTEALREMGKVRTDLAAFYAEHGRFPANAGERETFRITPSNGHPAIRNLSIHGVGACNLSAGCDESRIEVQLRRSIYLGIGGDAHSQLRLQGKAQPGGAIVWECGPRDVQPVKLKWLPSTCRSEF